MRKARTVKAVDWRVCKGCGTDLYKPVEDSLGGAECCCRSGYCILCCREGEDRQE